MKFTDTGKLLFQGGFHEASLTPEDPRFIVGKDSRYPEVGDFENTIKQSDSIGNVTIEYEGGTPEDRHAKIVPDPAGSGKNVMEFQLLNAVRLHRGRVQTSFYSNKGFHEVYFKINVYLHPDMKLLDNYPQSFDWLTLSDFWNEPFWDNSGFPFRIVLNLSKDQGVGKKLYFRLTSQLLTNDMLDLWNERNRKFEIPYGEWMTFEFYYKQGNLYHGRLKLDVTTADTVTHEVFNIHNWTQHPCNTHAAGLTHFNPMKLYAPDTLIDYVRNSGGVMRIYWDDFELRKDVKE